jgi:xanthine dehydrogenase YagR molybdenum-binding subunit
MSIGTPRTRIEAPIKVTGAAKYSADNYPAGTLHATAVGAPIPHGRILGIETARAAALRGVVRVFVAADMPRFGQVQYPVAVAKSPMQDDWIEWEGQAVALVIGETLEAVEEAAALVRVSVEARAPLLPGNGRIEAPPQRGMPSRERKGNADEGLAIAAATVSADYRQPTRHHNPMETSGTVAAWQGDRLTIWNSTQASFNAPPVLAAALGIPEANIRQVSPFTGGGFGSKGSVWPHEILAAVAARIVGRPVRLHLTRAQMYAQVGHQPEFRQTVTLGASADGKLTAVRHASVNTTSVSDVHSEAATMASRSNYASPNIELDHRIERVHVGVPTPMRAPVEGPGSWALESAMDELALKLGMDPLDLRLANHAAVHPMDGRPWSSNKLREACQEADVAYGWRTRRDRPREDGVWTIGHGLGGAGMFCARMPNAARVRVQANGQVIVESGTNDIGTGNQTVCAIVAADAFGIEPERVDVRWGENGFPKTSGVYGSSHTMGLGSAVLFAARDARRKLAAFGASAEGPLDLRQVMARAGVPEVVGEGSFNANQADMGERSGPGSAAEAGINLNGRGTPYAMQTFGVTMVEVGVDRDLGIIRLRRAVARYSAGRIVNPLAARSQMIGSIVWEWGKATMEASVIEPRHGRFLAKNLSNVAIPVNADIPSAIDVGFVEEDDRRASAIGARGIGELGATGVAAAVANAVYDAVGVRVRQVPILPHHILDGLEAAALTPT